MKNFTKLFLVFIWAPIALLSGCKKEENDPLPIKPMLTYTLMVENIISPGGSISTINRSFLNLYEGIVYTKAEAELNSSKVDFAYNYRGAGCSSCRFFENVMSMAGRTNYVQSFSTHTNCKIKNIEQDKSITIEQFDALNNGTEIENLFNTRLDISSLQATADITDRVTDVAQGRVFAFIEKTGRKGFFKVGDYLANVPSGDKATLQLTVKMVKD
jgi:hypothetical protein